jgi:hypothetical protein
MVGGKRPQRNQSMFEEVSIAALVVVELIDLMERTRRRTEIGPAAGRDSGG